MFLFIEKMTVTSYSSLTGLAEIDIIKYYNIYVQLTIAPSRYRDEQFVSPNFYTNRQRVFWNEFSFHHCHFSAGFIWIGEVHRSPEKSF